MYIKEYPQMSNYEFSKLNITAFCSKSIKQLRLNFQILFTDLDKNQAKNITTWHKKMMLGNRWSSFESSDMFYRLAWWILSLLWLLSNELIADLNISSLVLSGDNFRIFASFRYSWPIFSVCLFLARRFWSRFRCCLSFWQ